VLLSLTNSAPCRSPTDRTPWSQRRPTPVSKDLQKLAGSKDVKVRGKPDKSGKRRWQRWLRHGPRRRTRLRRKRRLLTKADESGSLKASALFMLLVS
jgi:hypothetical protein